MPNNMSPEQRRAATLRAGAMDRKILNGLGGQLASSAAWGIPFIAGPRAVYEASTALSRVAAVDPPQPPQQGFSTDVQRTLDTMTGVAGLPELFRRPGAGLKPPKQYAPPAMGDGGAPLPQQTTPGVNQPIVYSAAAGKASELNTRYQQAGGDISKNYWTANPEIKQAASDPNRLTSDKVGYENRADIQAWMNAQGRDSQVVKTFLADRARKGLLAKPGDYSNATISAPTQQAVIEGYRTGRSPLVATEDMQAIPLPDEISDGAMAAGLEYFRGKGGPNLAGSQGLSNSPNGPVDLRQAQAQASFAPGNQAASEWNTFAPSAGNFHSSDQIRGMNLSGDQALGDAKVNQMMATLPDPDAKVAEPDSAPAERPEDAFLNDRMRKLMAGGSAYSNGAISGIW